jgi:hypothetical protein
MKMAPTFTDSIMLFIIGLGEKTNYASLGNWEGKLTLTDSAE